MQHILCVVVIVELLNCVWHFHNSMYCRQEYWSGVPFPSRGDLPDPEIPLASPTWRVDSFTTEPAGKFILYIYKYLKYTCAYIYVCVCVCVYIYIYNMNSMI